jgi:hypothetical protein
MKFPWQKKVNESGEESIEINLPDDMKKQLEGAASKEEVKALGTKFDELKASLDSINKHFTTEAEEKKAKLLEEQRRKQTETQTQTEEELNELFLTDPVAATKKLLQMSSQPANTALLTMRADSIRRETFEDADKFPYYTGDIKSEIDKLLENEPLTNRNNRATVEHAYFSVVGRHIKDINEGKLKSRFASTEGNRGTSTGNVSGTHEDDNPKPLDDDGKKIAKMLGFTDEEYARMLKEEGVGYV